MKVFTGLLTLAVLSLFSAANLQADVIVLHADEWCPYNCADTAKQQGYMVEIAKKVFEKAGHTVEYKVANWSRSISEARDGKTNGIVGAARDDAPDFIYPDNSLGKSVSGVYVVKGSAWRYDQAKGADQFAAVTVGVIQDYSYGEDWKGYFEANGKDSKKVQAVSGDNGLEQNFQKLLKGRIGAVVDDLHVLEYTAKKMGVADKVEPAGESAKPDDVYIAFSPANPKSKEYAKTLSDGVEALRKSGELSAILAKYGLKDWK